MALLPAFSLIKSQRVESPADRIQPNVAIKFKRHRMRHIQPDLTEELLEHFKDPNKVGSSEPFLVHTFRELVEHTAKLSFRNKDYLLFYRGQSTDYRNKAGNSTFYPSIYRGDYLPIRELTNRYDILEGASKALVQLFEKEK